MIGSISKIKVRAEHGLLAEGGAGDDSMYVEEEARVTACEVRQVSFRHGSYVASNVFWQVLVVVFLPQRSCQKTPMRCAATLTLFRRARRRSCTERPSYFLNLPRFSTKILSSREGQSEPTTLIALCSSKTRCGSRGSRHMISKRSEASCKNPRRRPGSQK